MAFNPNTFSVDLGRVPKNRGTYVSGTHYYKDNIVQYQGSSFIANPTSANDYHDGNDGTAQAPEWYLTKAPFVSDPLQPSHGWEVFATGKHNFSTGENIDDVGITATVDTSNNLVRSNGVYDAFKDVSKGYQLISDFEGDVSSNWAWVMDVIIPAGAYVYNRGECDMNLYHVKNYDSPIVARVNVGEIVQVNDSVVAVRSRGDIVPDPAPTPVIPKHCSLWVSKDSLVEKIPQVDVNTANIAENTADILTKVDVKLGANLLDVEDPNRSVDKAINASGTVFNMPGHCVSDYIAVEASTNYRLSSKNGGLDSNYALCYYDANKDFISGVSFNTYPDPEITNITTPATCVYIRTTFMASRENLMINKGTEAVPYEPYSPIAGYLNRQDVQNKDYTNALTFLPYPAYTTGAKTTSGWYAGYEVSLAGLYDAGYRTVKFRASTYLSTGTITGGVICSSEGDTQSIGTIESSTKSNETDWTIDWFTLPITENSVKLVASYGKVNPTVNEVTHYIKFNPEVVYFRMESGEDVFPDMFMPSKIYGVYGKNLQLFNRSIVAAVDPYQWYHYFTCSKGRAYSRYFEIDLTKNIVIPANTKLKYKLMDGKCNASDERESLLVVADKPTTSPSAPGLNVLCIGASTTEGGEWASELKRMLTGGDNTHPYSYLLNTGNKYTVSEGDTYIIDVTVEGSQNPVPAEVIIKHSVTEQWGISISSDYPLPNSGTLTKDSGTGPDSIWYTSIKSKLPEGDSLTNINFFGRMDGNKPANCPVSIKVEATGGWRWKTFYTERLVTVKFTVSNVQEGIGVGAIYKYLNSNNVDVFTEVTEVNITEGSGTIRVVKTPEETNSITPKSDSGYLTKHSGNGPTSINYSAFEVEGEPCPFPIPTGETLPDFTTYVNEYCGSGSQLNVAIFNMGTNNEMIWSDADLNGVMDNMKLLIDGLHADYPGCKVIVGTGSGFSPYNGEEANYAANTKYKTPTMIYWNKKYLNAVKDVIDAYNAAAGVGNEWIFMANTVVETDSENAFPVAQKAVNDRMPDDKETVGENGVHPNLVGYQMLADSFYRCFVNTILN